jgi:hypothetical protein
MIPAEARSSRIKVFTPGEKVKTTTAFTVT